MENDAKKQLIDKLADIFLNETRAFVTTFCKTHNLEGLDMKVIASFHTGLLCGMFIAGYDKDVANQAYEIAVTKFHAEIEKTPQSVPSPYFPNHLPPNESML